MCSDVSASHQVRLSNRKLVGVCNSNLSKFASRNIVLLSTMTSPCHSEEINTQWFIYLLNKNISISVQNQSRHLSITSFILFFKAQSCKFCFRSVLWEGTKIFVNKKKLFFFIAVCRYLLLFLLESVVCFSCLSFVHLSCSVSFPNGCWSPFPPTLIAVVLTSWSKSIWEMNHSPVMTSVSCF